MSILCYVTEWRERRRERRNLRRLLRWLELR